jgi:hypothetical protein
VRELAIGCRSNEESRVVRRTRTNRRDGPGRAVGNTTALGESGASSPQDGVPTGETAWFAGFVLLAIHSPALAGSTLSPVS